MANAPRSSFIPKQVTTSAIPKKIRHTRVFSILGFISAALLLVSLLLSAGIFVLKDLEQRKLTERQDTLTAERGKFNEADIAEVRNFNARIELARTLLDAHVAPSKIFDTLEINTKQSVQYTSLEYVRRPSGDISLDLIGVTDDFAKVALQSMQYSEDFILKDMMVTEVGLSLGGIEEGQVSGGTKTVNFKIASNVDASKLLFESESTGSAPEVDVETTVGTSSVESVPEDTEPEKTVVVPSTSTVTASSTTGGATAPN